ncbi:MAG: hypothetical protein PHP22_05295 [Oscillospiraceae bacterium]|nr:hypothetical protein [Oscillospiraceae bacterium]
MNREDHGVLFLRPDEPSNLTIASRGEMALNRRIVLYGLVSGSCVMFALVLYWIADGLPESRIGLTVVTLTSLAIAVTAAFLLILTIVVRHKALQREEHREMRIEARPDLYPSEEEDDVSEEDENAAIFLKKNSEKNVK